MREAIIIGGGPCGLAAGIALQEKGIDYLIVEIGVITNSILSFPVNMRLYSTSDRLEIRNIPFLSEEDRSLRHEVLRYYRTVAIRMQMNILTFHRVTEVKRLQNSYLVQTVDHLGREAQFEARQIVIATGIYDQPRLMGIPGEQLPKVYQGIKPTLLLDIRNLIEKRRISFYPESAVSRIEDDAVHIDGAAGVTKIQNDFVFPLIGYQPDLDLLEKLGVQVDPEAKSSSFDPETHSTNIPSIFVAGVVAGGITNKVFIDDGRLHGPKIAATIGLSRTDSVIILSQTFYN